jgi:hypothetical protein
MRVQSSPTRGRWVMVLTEDERLALIAHAQRSSFERNRNSANIAAVGRHVSGLAETRLARAALR